jgi:hypothetical protein
MIRMRFSLAVAAMLMAGSMSGLAQKNNSYQAKPSDPLKVKQSAILPAGKKVGAGSASAANARDLQGVEQQSATPHGASQSAAKSSSQAAGKAGEKKTKAGLTPAKDPTTDKNPPMNFGAGGGKKPALSAQGPDPYKGRLRQKTHQ